MWYICNKFVIINNTRMKRTGLIALIALIMLPLMANAKRDKKFHIYLCLGQSNMEAGAQPAEQDKDFNNPRFQFLAADDMPKYGRKGKLERDNNRWHFEPMEKIYRTTEGRTFGGLTTCHRGRCKGCVLSRLRNPFA